jgi:hypothetical protein
MRKYDEIMRDYDEEDDPKKPQPVPFTRKRSNPAEVAEAVPSRKDDERNRHRHVV